MVHGFGVWSVGLKLFAWWDRWLWGTVEKCVEHWSESSVSVDGEGDEDCLVVEEVSYHCVAGYGWFCCVVGCAVKFLTFEVL